MDNIVSNVAAPELRVAVRIPCLKEAASISAVVRDVHEHLPCARVFVFDNDSDDDTVYVAEQSGATTRHVGRRGMGDVVRQMFSQVDADVYVTVDGDGTYGASCAPKLVEELLLKNADMVTAVRIAQPGAFPKSRQIGNTCFSALVTLLFGCKVSDLLSGYRAASKRLAKSFPATSSGFEVETELTIHAVTYCTMIGIFLIVSGIVLNAITACRCEVKRLRYEALPSLRTSRVLDTGTCEVVSGWSSSPPPIASWHKELEDSQS